MECSWESRHELRSQRVEHRRRRRMLRCLHSVGTESEVRIGLLARRFLHNRLDHFFHRTWNYRRTEDERVKLVLVLHRLAKLAEDATYRVEALCTVGSCRSAHTDKRDFRFSDGSFGIVSDLQATALDGIVQESQQPQPGCGPTHSRVWPGMESRFSGRIPSHHIRDFFKMKNNSTSRFFSR